MPAELHETINRALEEELRQKLDGLISQSLSEAAEQLRGRCDEAVEAATREERERAAAESGTAVAETLQASVRRIRGEDSVTGIASALVDGAAKFCGRSALLIHKGDQLLGFRAAGEVDEETNLKLARLSFGAHEASAIAHTLSSLDSTTTQGEPGTLSGGLVELLGLGGGDAVSLFPIVLRDRALAVLYCDGKDGKAVVTPAIETLVAMAEAWIEAVGTRRKQASNAA